MTEDRKITEVREIGNENLVELAPGGNENLKIEVTRVMLMASRLQSIFDDEEGKHGNAINGIQSLLDFNYPFDIFVLMRTLPIGNPEIDASACERDDQVKPGSYTSTGVTNDFSGTEPPTSFGSVIIMDHFHECWFSHVDYEIKAADADMVITESGTINYTWRTGTPMTQRKDLIK
jgi:hypothetical protein